MGQYFVAGRICDHEDHFKLVVANSKAEANCIFEKYVRELEEKESNDFYIEHCQSISEMQQHLIGSGKGNRINRIIESFMSFKRSLYKKLYLG